MLLSQTPLPLELLHQLLSLLLVIKNIHGGQSPWRGSHSSQIKAVPCPHSSAHWCVYPPGLICPTFWWFITSKYPKL
jgi:hypothetical protein